MSKCPNVTVIDPTAKIHHLYTYGYPVSQEIIHENYSESIVDDLFERQPLEQRSSKCIVFDGCLYDKSWFKHDCMNMLFMNGRNFKIKHIITMQYPLPLPFAMRANTDYIFIFREPLMSARKRLYEMYARVFPSLDSFCDAMEQIEQEPFTCLVINNTFPVDKLEDIVMLYKVQPPWKVMVEMKKVWLDIIREDLMQRTWHPSRLRQCLSYDEVDDIFE